MIFYQISELIYPALLRLCCGKMNIYILMNPFLPVYINVQIPRDTGRGGILVHLKMAGTVALKKEGPGFHPQV